MKSASGPFVFAMMAMAGSVQAAGTGNSLTTWARLDSEGEVALDIEPRLRLAYQHDHSFLELTAGAELSAPLESNDLDDARADLELTLGQVLAGGARVALETGYVFSRDYDGNYSPAFAAIDIQREATANIAASWQWRQMAFAMNAGATATLFEDLERLGLEPFSRSARNHVDPVLSLRLTAQGNPDASPFVESAYVARIYPEDHLLDYHGLEVICGMTFDQAALSGDIGAIVSVRVPRSRQTELQWAAGPYVDVEWRISQQTVVQIDALMQLVQDETGDNASSRNLSMNLAVEHAFSDNLHTNFGLGVEVEDMSADLPVTWTPGLRLSTGLTTNMSLVARLGAEIETARHRRATASATAALGLEIAF